MEQPHNYDSERQELLPAYDDIYFLLSDRAIEFIDVHLILGFIIVQFGLGNILVGLFAEMPECVHESMLYVNIVHGSLLICSGVFIIVIALNRLPKYAIRVFAIVYIVWGVLFVSVSMEFILSYDVDCQPFLMRWNMSTIVISSVIGVCYGTVGACLLMELDDYLYCVGSGQIRISN